MVAVPYYLSLKSFLMTLTAASTSVPRGTASLSKKTKCDCPKVMYTDQSSGFIPVPKPEIVADVVEKLSLTSARALVAPRPRRASSGTTCMQRMYGTSKSRMEWDRTGDVQR